MARSPAPGTIQSSPEVIRAVNLSRMVDRLQKVVGNSDTRLQTSIWERRRVASLIQHAIGLLSQVERDADDIRLQTKKQETQADLIRKRDILTDLSSRLQDLIDIGDNSLHEGEDEEDILGSDTPEESADDHDTPASATPAISIADTPTSEPEYVLPTPAPEAPEVSNLRARNVAAKSERDQLLSSPTTGMTTATSEMLLSTQRAEQEALTTSMLSMAAQLKQSANAFNASLDMEKDVLAGATKGLEKNELGMEAASRRMGFLRSYTEGKGWWGRMLMYAWIFGLMVIAVLVVFVMPKLRF